MWIGSDVGQDALERTAMYDFRGTCTQGRMLFALCHLQYSTAQWAHARKEKRAVVGKLTFHTIINGWECGVRTLQGGRAAGRQRQSQVRGQTAGGLMIAGSFLRMGTHGTHGRSNSRSSSSNMTSTPLPSPSPSLFSVCPHGISSFAHIVTDLTAALW